MTRETKIGLLVGLAFIIVIGILLSEQLGRSTESPPAPISRVSDNVRKSDNVPGSGNVSRNGPVSPANVTPTEQVPQPEEVGRNNADSGAIVQVGPGPSREPAARPGDEAINVGPPALFHGASTGRGDDTGAVRTQTPAAPVDDNEPPLGKVARENGEPVEPIARRNGNTSPEAWSKTLGGPAGGSNTADRRPTAPTGTKAYQAQAGDSLARIATRQLGADTTANRQAIIRANPSLAANPDLIVAGRTYNIPAADRHDGTKEAARPSPAGIAARPGTGVGTPPTEHFYTVKHGDTLWGIATHEIGTANAVAAIAELNKETLKGSEGLREGMKLRLPAKPLASAN